MNLCKSFCSCCKTRTSCLITPSFTQFTAVRTNSGEVFLVPLTTLQVSFGHKEDKWAVSSRCTRPLSNGHQTQVHCILYWHEIIQHNYILGAPAGCNKIHWGQGLVRDSPKLIRCFRVRNEFLPVRYPAACCVIQKQQHGQSMSTHWQYLITCSTCIACIPADSLDQLASPS